MSARHPRQLAGLVLAAALVLAACGDDDDDSDDVSAATTTTSGDETTSSTTPEATTTTTPAETTTTPVPGVVVDVSVAGGEVHTAQERVPVPLGEQVTVRVNSDVADEVHVHGYDLLADVGPGMLANITFTADIPGVFEVELEGAHQLLVELEVS
jgi:cytoskeletal protein RodZ